VGRQYPRLAHEMRDLAAMNQRLDHSRPELPAPLPQRLGEFDLVRRIDGGGMGEIYEAVQRPLGRRVVVKTIRQGRGTPESP